MRVDGKSYSVEEPPAIDHRRKHSVEVVVDRIAVREGIRPGIADAVEAALDLGRGVMHVGHVDDQRAVLHGTGEAWIELASGVASAPRGRSKTRGADATPLAERIVRFHYKGLFPAIDETSRVSFVYRQRLDHLVSEVACSTCHGSRLRDDAAAVRFQERTLGEMGDQPLGRALDFFKGLKLSKEAGRVAGELLREISNRLQFLVD